MGGTLYQDIEDHWQDCSAEYTTQRLMTEPNTVLREIYGEISHINSFHHQSIKDLAPNLKIAAHDPKDDIIEAVMSTDDVAFLGVQWHPEFLFENRPKDKTSLTMSLMNFRLNLSFTITKVIRMRDNQMVQEDNPHQVTGFFTSLVT